MEQKEQSPVMPLGSYRLERADRLEGIPFPFDCSDCNRHVVDSYPTIDITRKYFRIGITCPYCGVSTQLMDGPITRLRCVNPSSQDDI